MLEEVFGGPETPVETEATGGVVVLPDSAPADGIEGPFFVGAAEKLTSTIERAQLHNETVAMRLGRIPFLDATGMHTLAETIE